MVSVFTLSQIVILMKMRIIGNNVVSLRFVVYTLHTKILIKFMIIVFTIYLQQA
jgi:hypothetical protein